MYVIRRIEDGMFLARPGSKFSYTFLLQEARGFLSKEKALDSCCPKNEAVVSVDSIIYTQNTFGD